MPTLGPEETFAWYEDKKSENRLEAEKTEDGFPILSSETKAKFEEENFRGWFVDPNAPNPIRRHDGKFFEVVRVDIPFANNREITGWDQPMIRELDAKEFEGLEKKSSDASAILMSSYFCFLNVILFLNFFF